MLCYSCDASGHKSYECSYFIYRFQRNNCNKTGHKALDCCQPREQVRYKTEFLPRDSSHTQRGKPNSLQLRRVFSGKFTKFPRS